MSQRKFSYIPLALIIIVGAVWAGSMITPDKPGFPSLPNTVGTIGNILEPGRFFRADGTAINGNMLWNMNTGRYLNGTTCAASDASWKGIDASGNPICKWPPLAFAEIYEWAMSVNGVVQPIGTKLREWDRIQTNATQTGTIKFYNNPGANPTSMGDSIARLGTGTSVYIDRGDTLGTLALVNLEDGLLWWRVLSSTGIDFGGGGVIAGVRGTSLSLKEPSVNQFQFTIPHSQHPTEAATLSANDGLVGANPQNMWVLGQIQVYSGGPFPYISTPWTISDLSTLYDMDPWVRSNTLADIKYMTSLPQTPMIAAELAATTPNDEPKRYGLCRSNEWYWYGTGVYGCVLAYADASTNYDLKWSPDMKWEILSIKDITSNPLFKDGRWIWASTNYSPHLTSTNRYSVIQDILNSQAWWNNQSTCNGISNSNARNYCNFLHDSKNDGYDGILASRVTGQNYVWITNLNTWTGWVYSKALLLNWIHWTWPYGAIDMNIFDSSHWLNINWTGKYLTFINNTTTPLSYLQTGSGGNYSSLAGKTITIELGWVMPSVIGTSYYALSLSSNTFVAKYNWTWLCRFNEPSPRTCSSSELSFNPDTNTVSINIPTGIPISWFIIGNNSTWVAPIGTSIRKIIIQ